MAQYGLFHELRRQLAQLNIAGISEPLTCYHNKEQLSKWLASKMPLDIHQDVASDLAINYCSFVTSINTPVGHIATEVSYVLPVVVARVLSAMSHHRNNNPGAFGNSFESGLYNAYGKHNYDFEQIKDKVQADDILISSFSSAPDDFIEKFPNRLISSGKMHTEYLALINGGAMSCGVAIYAKGKGILQVHVGASVSKPVSVRIIANTHQSSHLDKMLALNSLMEKP